MCVFVHKCIHVHFSARSQLFSLISVSKDNSKCVFVEKASLSLTQKLTWSILSSTFYFPPFSGGGSFFLLLSLQIYSGILKPENICNCLFITYFSLNFQLLCITSRISCNQFVRLWIPRYSKQVRTQNRQLMTFSVTFMNEE